jgi:hypothetical protein
MKETCSVLLTACALLGSGLFFGCDGCMGLGLSGDAVHAEDHFQDEPVVDWPIEEDEGVDVWDYSDPDIPEDPSCVEWPPEPDGHDPASRGWAKTFGGEMNDQPHSIKQTPDGGYVVVGQTRSFGVAGYAFWVFRLDAAGNVLWQKALDSSNDEKGLSVDLTADGGFIVAGEIQLPTPMGLDYVVARLDQDGEPEWIQVYGCSNWVEPSPKVLACSDGGYILAGFTHCFGVEDVAPWIVKLDSAGVIEWQIMYRHSFADAHAHAIVETPDRGYVVAGFFISWEDRGSGFFLMKINDLGIAQWAKVYDGGRDIQALDLIQTQDCGFALVGSTFPPINDPSEALVIKTDEEGHFESMISFGNSGDGNAHAIVERPGGGYAIGGSYAADTSGHLFENLLVLTDESLAIESQTHYGRGDIQSMQITSDWGLVAACISNMNEDTRSDALIIKMDPDRYVGTGCPEGFGEEVAVEVISFPIQELDLSLEIFYTTAYSVDVDFTVKDTDAQEVSICAP